MNTSIARTLDLLGPLFYEPSLRHECLYAAIGIQARKLHDHRDSPVEWDPSLSLDRLLTESDSRLAFQSDIVLKELARLNGYNTGISGFLHRRTEPFSFAEATSRENCDSAWLRKCFEVVQEVFCDKEKAGDLFSQLIAELYSARHRTNSFLSAGNHVLNELVSDVVGSVISEIGNSTTISDPCSGIGDLVFRTAKKLGFNSNVSAYEYSLLAAKMGSIASEAWGLPLSPPHPQDTFEGLVYHNNLQDILVADIPGESSSTRSQFGYLSGETHWSWISKTIDGLSPEGLAFIVVPRNILERSNLSDAAQRKNLLEQNMLRAVLHFRLPLRAHSNSESVLLILGRPSTRRSVLLVDWKLEIEYMQLHNVLNKFFTTHRLLSEPNWAKVCSVDELLLEESNWVPLRRLPYVLNDTEPSLADAQQQLVESAERLSQAETNVNQTFEALNNL